MLITPAYASIIALVFVVLSIRTLLLRRQLGVGIGSGNDPRLERATRVHSNFAEYVPIALLLIYFLETRTDMSVWIHILCVVLLTGRVLHAYGVSHVDEDYRYRVVGMALTLTAIMSAAIRLIIHYAGQLAS